MAKGKKIFEGVHAKNRREIEQIRRGGLIVAEPVAPAEPTLKKTNKKNKNKNDRGQEHEQPQISDEDSTDTSSMVFQNVTIDNYAELDRREDAFHPDNCAELEINPLAEEVLNSIVRDVAEGVEEHMEINNKQYNDRLREHMSNGIISPDDVHNASSTGIKQWREQLLPHTTSRGKEQ